MTTEAPPTITIRERGDLTQEIGFEGQEVYDDPLLFDEYANPADANSTSDGVLKQAHAETTSGTTVEGLIPSLRINLSGLGLVNLRMAFSEAGALIQSAAEGIRKAALGFGFSGVGGLGGSGLAGVGSGVSFGSSAASAGFSGSFGGGGRITLPSVLPAPPGRLIGPPAPYNPPAEPRRALSSPPPPGWGEGCQEVSRGVSPYPDGTMGVPPFHPGYEVYSEEAVIGKAVGSVASCVVLEFVNFIRRL